MEKIAEVEESYQRQIRELEDGRDKWERTKRELEERVAKLEYQLVEKDKEKYRATL